MARLTSTVTLALLAALSIGSFVLVEGEAASLVVGLAAFGIALVKIVLILNRFMHLEWHHRHFAQALAVWLVVVGVILGAGVASLPWDGHATIAADKSGMRVN